MSARLCRAAAVSVVVVAVLSYWPILQVRRQYYDTYQGVVARAWQTPNGIVDGTDFEAMTARLKANPLLECNYVFTFSFDNWDAYERGLSLFLTKGADEDLVTTVLPESMPRYYRSR